MIRFGSTGTEATIHAIRLARAATGREKIIKFEGAYHGAHDSALVSVKPHAPEFGNVGAPDSVPSGLGVPKAAINNVAVATFNDLDSVALRFERGPWRNCSGHRRTDHDERRPLHAATGIPPRLASALQPERHVADFRRGQNRGQALLGRGFPSISVWPQI